MLWQNFCGRNCHIVFIISICEDFPATYLPVKSDPPGPPGEPTAEEVGGDFVSLTWERPKMDGGGRILGYFIEKKDAESSSWVRINQSPSPANIFNVPHLIEDREYDFRVFAVNEAGESPPAATGRRIRIKDPKGIISCRLSLVISLSVSLLSLSVSRFTKICG